MPTKFNLYQNDNGRVTRESGILPDDVTFDGLVNLLMRGGLPEFTDLVLPPPPRSNKAHCTASFPPSKAWVDPKTKEYKIILAANDVMDDEYQVDLDDNIIIVTFNRQREEGESIYDWKGLRFVKDEVVKFKFDPRLHDASTAKVELTRGCLFITIQPREECKPIRKILAGGLKAPKEQPAEEDTKKD